MKSGRPSSSVLLRLRIVKLKGSEHRMVDSIKIVAGARPADLSVSRPEWAEITLASPDDEIVFQTSFENASCICREIDGRKRITFSDHFQMLIEGYWVVKSLVNTVLQPKVNIVTTQTQNCQVSFMSTKGGDGYDLETEERLPIFGVPIDFSHPTTESTKPKRLLLDDGPVCKALEWLTESLHPDAVYPPVTPSTRRFEYQPSDATSGRMRWDPSLTSMQPVAARSSEMDELLRAVDFSQNLNKMYFL